MKEKLLPKEFYASEDVEQIAKDLLGKKLISKIDGKVTKGIIVETEAYKAPEDLASHAKGNRRTPKNETMFWEGGHMYIYISYGVHHLFNAVTGPKELPHAVLIRAIEPLEGEDIMMKRRKMDHLKYQLVNGPGKFSVAMGISTKYDGLKLYDEKSPLQIAESDVIVKEIVSGPRVGMSHHTKECGYWPFRYRIQGNKWASKPDIVKYDW